MEQIVENQVPKQMPKGYAKSVLRLRKQKEAKDKARREEELKAVGQQYSRGKLDRMRPPSFVDREPKKT